MAWSCMARTATCSTPFCAMGPTIAPTPMAAPSRIARGCSSRSTKACAQAIGAGRLGVRISPVSTAGDSRDSNPQALFNHVVKGLNPFGLAYVHVVEGETGGPRYTIPFDYSALHGCFDGVWMVNNGYDWKLAMDAVARGRADLVSFGRLFIANPDLVERLRENAPLNPLMGPDTFYGGGAHGYTDYPTLDQSRAPTGAEELALA